MIFAHLAGLDEDGRNLLYKQAKKYAIVDLDELTDKIVSDKNMESMFQKYEYHLEKSKDSNLTKLQQKQETSKFKDLDRRMNIYWKTKIQKMIDHADKLHSNPVILIGYSTYFKNTKITIDIKTSLKFFQKVQLEDHARNLVEMNLDNYREEIIDGVFPLDYLNHDTIIKKRNALTTQYRKMGYQIDTINNIMNSIFIAATTKPPVKLYYATMETVTDTKKKLPIVDGRLVAYSEDWLAIVAALTNNNTGIIKGFSNGRPFIKENIENAFQTLNKPIDLYLIQTTDNFAPIASKNTVYKYQTAKPTTITSKLYIDNAMDKLQDINIQIIPYKLS